MNFEDQFKQLVNSDTVSNEDFRNFVNGLIHKINGNISIQMGVIEELCDLDLSDDKKELLEISMQSLKNINSFLRSMRESYSD